MDVNFADFAVRLLTAKYSSSKKVASALRKQCIQPDDQQKINHKNPFIPAFREIYVPQKLLRIRYYRGIY